jgi:carbohydrate-selective porin OprB
MASHEVKNVSFQVQLFRYVSQNSRTSPCAQYSATLRASARAPTARSNSKDRTGDAGLRGRVQVRHVDHLPSDLTV